MTLLILKWNAWNEEKLLNRVQKICALACLKMLSSKCV